MTNEPAPLVGSCLFCLDFVDMSEARRPLESFIQWRSKQREH